MPSERMQRRIDALLDQAESASDSGAWTAVAEKARAVLAIDEANEDALSFLKMAEANGVSRRQAASAEPEPSAPVVSHAATSPSLPRSFVSGRYRVLRLLGQGARKKVYLARDERLGREVAFAVIPAGGLSAGERERVLREAQAMARLGASPHLVSIFDIGEDGGDIFTVQEFMPGGDVAGALTPGPSPDTAGEGRKGLPVERTLAIARMCAGR
jgi:hypothetical protein